ncbi:MAG: hypothetical protein Q7J44_10530 [Pseudotabrizicola sp.]|uniref:hypothetical protein n=1 Tax=Pseudotabrizicola sp. TaxID=2939647 RepID=UPI00271BC7A7|nr:hypothetical protein [Pseudotabrizicola sp.]MDO9638967.1 hypothetical protein [Pseudotabrizicola sp.]
MSQTAFMIWFALLSGAVAILFWLLHGGPDAASVGGGGYDLGPFIYAWLLVLLSGLWTVMAFVAGLATKGGAPWRAFVLGGLGLAVFVLTLWLHGSDLS